MKNYYSGPSYIVFRKTNTHSSLCLEKNASRLAPLQRHINRLQRRRLHTSNDIATQRHTPEMDLSRLQSEVSNAKYVFKRPLTIINCARQHKDVVYAACSHCLKGVDTQGNGYYCSVHHWVHRRHSRYVDILPPPPLCHDETQSFSPPPPCHDVETQTSSPPSTLSVPLITSSSASLPPLIIPSSTFDDCVGMIDCAMLQLAYILRSTQSTMFVEESMNCVAAEVSYTITSQE